MMISPFLRKAVDREGRVYLSYWCQGCETIHQIVVKRPGDERGWDWDSDVMRPTFSPNVLYRSGHYMDSWKQGDPCWCSTPEEDGGFKCHRCHTFIRGGMVQFLPDCSHSLAGMDNQPLPELPEGWQS